MRETYSHRFADSQEGKWVVDCAADAWQVPCAMSSALTRGIRVTVSSFYLAERSSPANHQYAFAYTVRISNEGRETSQLRSRHWIITDGDGKVQEVRGEGVVGAQPLLKPGQHFEYTS